MEKTLQNQIEGIFKILNIIPKNKKLYMQALTHKTFINENKEFNSYEKLEFLGDSILQHYTSLYIFEKHKNESEGTMSSIRANFVSRESLARIVKELGLNKFIICSNNVDELQSNDKICSDIFESLLAAIYLDLGEQTTIKFLKKFFFPVIKQNIDTICLKDPKTHLQELLQPIFKKSVQYDCCQDENKDWQAKAICQGIIYGVGMGKTKKEAEINAAENALTKLSV